MSRYVVVGDKKPNDSFFAVCPQSSFELISADSSALRRSAVTRLIASSVLKDRKDGQVTVFIPSFEATTAQQEAAALLQDYNACYLGCRAGPLAYRPQDILMMSVYCDTVPISRFAMLDSTRPKSMEDLRKLQYPVRLAAMTTVWSKEGELALDIAAATSAAEKLFEESVFVCAFEHTATNEQSTTVDAVVVAYGRDASTVIVEPSSSLQPLTEAQAQELEKHAKAIAVHVLNHSGVCKGSFAVVGEALRLDSLQLGSGLVEALTARPDLLPLVTADAIMHRNKLLKNYVVTFDAATKGYHLRASRPIRKGEIVFEDERRSFVVVTKEFVRRTWSEEDKVVFTRYAWPLDGDGHVYAIWDDEPGRWRPINHSCDPTCIYAVPHSLNVIASRDIAEGDDLTLDYASFCDFTMKPFQCHCGTTCCRGLIQPDEASLQKYGKTAWHRKQPPLEGL